MRRFFDGRPPRRPLACLVALAGLLVPLVVPSSAAAQRAERTVATLVMGNREVAIGVGTDGLVTFAVGGYIYPDHVAARERSSTRERYDPDEVLAWVQGVRRWVPTVRDSVRHAERPTSVYSASLGPSWQLGRRLQVSLARAGQPFEASISIGQCGEETADGGLSGTREDVARFLWALERAAVAARQSRFTERPPGVAPDSVFEEHQVSCPARPRDSNPRPEFPTVARGKAPPPSSYELLASFVVDSAGRPETATLRTPPGSDPRFVASFEETLPVWRYVPARRAGHLVRQRVHAAVAFRRWRAVPPTASDRIPVAPAGDGSRRIAIGPLRNVDWKGAASEAREYVFDLIPAERALRWADSAARYVREDGRLPRGCSDGEVQCSFTLNEGAGAGIALSIRRRPDGRVLYDVDLVRCQHVYSPGVIMSRAQVQALVASVRAAAGVAATRPRRPSRAAAGRPRYAHEVACPAGALIKAKSSPQAWAFDGWRSGEMVVARFVVDTAGRADPRSVQTLPGARRQAVDSLRYLLHAVRFTPATLGGDRVPQLVHWALPIDVGPADPGAFDLLDPRMMTDAGHGAFTGLVMTDGAQGVGGVQLSLARTDSAGSDELPLPYSVVTDAGGGFSFPALVPGSYRLRVRVIGYRPPEASIVTVRAGEHSDVNIALERR